MNIKSQNKTQINNNTLTERSYSECIAEGNINERIKLFQSIQEEKKTAVVVVEEEETECEKSIIEEKLLSIAPVHPLYIIGWEGVFGISICTVVLIMFQQIPCES